VAVQQFSINFLEIISWRKIMLNSVIFPASTLIRLAIGAEHVAANKLLKSHWGV
jgi:hypothetical protein